MTIITKRILCFEMKIYFLFVFNFGVFECLTFLLHFQVTLFSNTNFISIYQPVSIYFVEIKFKESIFENIFNKQDDGCIERSLGQ